jgi:hypothetical protein
MCRRRRGSCAPRPRCSSGWRRSTDRLSQRHSSSWACHRTSKNFSFYWFWSFSFSFFSSFSFSFSCSYSFLRYDAAGIAAAVLSLATPKEGKFVDEFMWQQEDEM